MRKIVLSWALCLAACYGLQAQVAEITAPEDHDTLRYEMEKHLQNVQRISYTGENAEAYWSFDSKKLVMQITDTENSLPCDQIFYFDISWGDFKAHPPVQVSNGEGRTTCSYFLPGDTTVVFASTHKSATDCPVAPERKKGEYYWPVYDTYEIYTADLEGNILSQLTDSPGYDAEATVSPQGDKIVFTSTRSGDLELWVMNIDGTNPIQITDALGYDGGAFFSPDGSKIVFRASRPKSEEEQTKYKDLLARGLVEPSAMEIFVCNADGSDLHQVTSLGKANWAPFFTPKGEKIIFSSNHHAGERGFKFNLFMINPDGTGLEQVTYDETFDSFPMFSPDGTKLVFGSNRFNGGTRSTNVFIADWIP